MYNERDGMISGTVAGIIAGVIVGMVVFTFWVDRTRPIVIHEVKPDGRRWDRISWRCDESNVTRSVFVSGNDVDKLGLTGGGCLDGGWVDVEVSK